MIQDALASYKTLYLETAREYLQSITRALIQLKENPANNELVNQVYIGAHSLKSQSVVMGFTHTGFLCHTIEYLFHEVKEGKIILSLSLVESVERGVAKIQESILSIEKENKEINMTDNIRELEGIILRVT